MAGREEKNTGRANFVAVTSDESLPESYGVEKNWAKMHGVDTGFSGVEHHKMYTIDGKVCGNTSAEKSANVASAVYDQILGRMVSGFPETVGKVAFQYLVQNIGYSVRMENQEKIPFVMSVTDEPGQDQAFTIICGNRNIWAIKTRDKNDYKTSKFHMAMYYNRLEGTKNVVQNVAEHFDYYGKQSGVYESKIDAFSTKDGGCVLSHGCRIAQVESEDDNTQEGIEGMTISTTSSVMKIEPEFYVGHIKVCPSDEYIASVFVPAEDGKFEDIPTKSSLNVAENAVARDVANMLEEANRINYYTSIQEMNKEA